MIIKGFWDQGKVLKVKAVLKRSAFNISTKTITCRKTHVNDEFPLCYHDERRYTESTYSRALMVHHASWVIAHDASQASIMYSDTVTLRTESGENQFDVGK